MAVQPPRPGVTPQLPARTGQAGGARAAAQRAFFDAALNKTSATSAPVVAQKVQAPPPQPGVTRLRAETVQQPQEQPTRILRPGSLLDIKV
ncbi:hypothetical protein [Phenylobacterium montanum]|uniref:Uncharacterized protein n=1 Tax=Phenylobacterium montanum TaxID=2823693 RepID=A0A975ITR2_9CAUL|nr:hypothetical protein [Caulobacter sp. S6]QUD87033.1 hypothetical protein KCG34_18455 [Caulobacter sp. S6]